MSSKYEVILSPQAEKDFKTHIRSGNKALVDKIRDLLIELSLHPESGTGKPERLKGGETARWSRRINGKHRLIYKIEQEVITVLVISMHGHYEDK